MGYGIARIIKFVKKDFIIYFTMGLFYYAIEILWRGFSYWQMIIVAMTIAFLIDGLNENIEWDIPLYKQVFYATLISVSVEFISGLIFRSFGLMLWDYSNMPFNILGVVQLYYCMAWIPLSALAIFMSDFLRWLILKEEFPHYKIWR